MGILTSEKIDECLYNYYVEHFGERDSDRWCERPAVNVAVFVRDGRIITLKCHILKGYVSETVETL